jgi:hypothetical protein
MLDEGRRDRLVPASRLETGAKRHRIFPPEDALTRVLGVGSAPMLQADIVFTGALVLVFILVVVPIAYWIVRGIARSIRRL